MLVFGLRSTSDDWLGWLTDSNPICHPSPVKKWNPHFWIMFNFWWLAGLFNELKPHLPPISSQKNEMLIFGFCSTSDDQPGWSMDSNPICHPSPPKKMKCSFLDYIQLLMIGQAGWWTLTPSTTPLTQKNEMLIFGLCSTSDDWLSCSIDMNPIHHPSPAKNMKCLFLYNIQHLMLARLVNGHKPHLPPLFSQKHETLIFGLHSTSDNWLGWVMDSNPIHHPSPAKKMKCSFLDYIQLLIIGRAGRWTQTPSTTHLQPIKWNPHFCITLNFWWSAGLVDGLEPHLPTLSIQKNEMLIFGFCSTSDDQPGW